MSLSNFLKGKVLSKVDSITAKASGALSLVDGAVTAVDSFFNSLFTNVLTGNNAITNLNFTYEEESVVSKDKIITSTAIDPLRAPITSTQDSPTFADAASNPSITKISSTQPNDLTIEPIGIEPPMAFKGQYPYVHTYKSESGHVKEVDDTPGQERLLDYHRSGTYQEIASDGRRVVKVVADNFEVIVGDDQVYIQGSGNMYVRGNMNITCLNDVAINVGGRVEINATEEFRVKAKSIALESSSGNIDLYSSKSINTRSGANTSIYAKSNMNVLASDSISVEAASNIAMEAKSKASIKTNDEISMDSAVVLTNMGTSLSTASDASVSVAKKTGLGSGPTRENTTAPSIVESVIQGIDDDEGAQIQALEDAVTSGRLTREEVDELKNKSYSADETDTTKAGETSPIATTANEIKAIPETGISGELKLSDKYRLSHLTAPGPVFDNQLRACGGRTKAQLAGNLSLLAQNVLEPINKKFGPITINSAFRPGSGKSQHERGMAVDITYGDRSRDPETMFAIAQWIKDHVAFDQLILEYGVSQIWTHISFNGEGSQRYKVDTCPNTVNPKYVSGLQKLAWTPKSN
jgi:hypothetical protein